MRPEDRQNGYEIGTFFVPRTSTFRSDTACGDIDFLFDVLHA